MRILFSLLALLVLQFDGLFAMHSDLQGLSPSETNKMYKSKLLYSNVLERVINNSVPTITLVEGMHADLVGKNPAQQNVLYRDVVSKIDALKQKIASEGLPLPSEADYLYSSPARTIRLDSAAASFTSQDNQQQLQQQGNNTLVSTVNPVVDSSKKESKNSSLVAQPADHWLISSAKGVRVAISNSLSAATDYVKNNPGTVLSYAGTFAAGAAGGFALGRATKK